VHPKRSNVNFPRCSLPFVFACAFVIGPEGVPVGRYRQPSGVLIGLRNKSVTDLPVKYAHSGNGGRPSDEKSNGSGCRRRSLRRAREMH
jgi:hypothetical protein